MLAWWWGTHKDKFDEWRDYRRMTILWFGHPNVQLTKKYDGRNDLRDHLVKWTIFCHTLDIIPMNWYLEMELYNGTVEWDILREGFFMIFNFEDGFENIDEAM